MLSIASGATPRTESQTFLVTTSLVRDQLNINPEEHTATTTVWPSSTELPEVISESNEALGIVKILRYITLKQ